MKLLGRGGGTDWVGKDYVPMEIPRAGVEILDVFVRDRKTHGYIRLGALTDILENSTSGTPYEGIERGRPVPNMDHLVGHTNKVSIALAAFELLLTACGVKLSLDGHRSRHSQLRYEISGASQDLINLIRLDGWLAEADLAGNSRTAAELLVSDRLFIAVGTIYATTVKLSLIDGGSARVNVDISPTLAPASIASKVEHSSSRQTDATIKSVQPLCIGVKLARVFCTLPAGYHLSIDPIGDKDDRIRGTKNRKYEFATDDQLVLYDGGHA